MDAIALRPIRVRSTGEEFLPGDSVRAEPAKLLQWAERGLVQIVDEGGDKDTGEDRVTWNSPLFGPLEAPLLEKGPTHFRLIHPLTGETVTLPNEWLVSLDERSAILEYDGSLPGEDADAQARREFFGLFRKGGT